MKTLIALPVGMLGLFLLLRLLVGFVAYPPAIPIVMFFPISLLFNWQVAIIMEAHLFGVGLCYSVVSALVRKHA